MTQQVMEALNMLALFTVGLVGGHAVVSMMTNNKKEMALEEQPNPTDAESMMYENSEAKVIEPYSLYEGAQGSLYRDFVFEGQDHFPFDGEMYSRPALTTLMYDEAFGSGPSRTINLPYRIHESEPITLLDGPTIGGTYAMGSPTTLGAETFAATNGCLYCDESTKQEDNCPRGMIWDEEERFCVPSEQPASDYEAESFEGEATPQMQLGDKIEGSQNSLIETSTSAWVGKNWKELGYHPNEAHYPLIRPRTNNPVVSDMINGVASIEVPQGQFLSHGRDTAKIYEPYTFLHENPQLDAQLTDGTETKTRREWDTSANIFAFSDQNIRAHDRMGGRIINLRRV